MGIFKKNEPEFHRMVVTPLKHGTSGQSIVGLVEVFFKKYNFKYKVVDDEGKDFHDRLNNYEIEIYYKDKDYIEVLINNVFTNATRNMTLNQYERWMKTERLRRKILNI